MHLLDTDICIYILNKRPPAVIARLEHIGFDRVAVSSITVAELRYGAEKSRLGARNKRALHQFITSLHELPFGRGAATVYASVRAGLERRGISIGPLDTLLAAHALSLGATLVTNNTREFARVPELRLENWAEV